MSEKLDPIAPDIAALLDAERHYDAESPARQGRVLEHLAATTAALAPAAPPTPSPLPKAILKTKLAVATAAAVVGAMGGGVVGYRLGERARPPAPVVSAPATAITAEVAPSVVVPDAAVPPAPSAPPPQASAARPPAPARAKKEDSADTLAVELSLVQMARAALARGNYAAALDATEQHARTFPKGHLTEERESLAIQALVGAGRDAEARARAARFRAKYPQSPLLPTLPPP
ncbi:hypothetical protein LVJ94_40180 [Pendulispora rubella]|uniref:Outer membrane protein assembly factor BamD n=1 Tax=Pendulispora rubella TaxID=2741070 RepID=A0ABZ2KWN9_9BACT